MFALPGLYTDRCWGLIRLQNALRQLRYIAGYHQCNNENTSDVCWCQTYFIPSIHNLTLWTNMHVTECKTDIGRSCKEMTLTLTHEFAACFCSFTDSSIVCMWFFDLTLLVLWVVLSLSVVMSWWAVLLLTDKLMLYMIRSTLPQLILIRILCYLQTNLCHQNNLKDRCDHQMKNKFYTLWL